MFVLREVVYVCDKRSGIKEMVNDRSGMHY